MINKTLVIALLGILLVSSLILVDAKQINQADKLDYKTTKYLIKADGVYNNLNQLVKEKDKAEVWIDKKVDLGKDKVQYHVDSLKLEDVKVDIELYFEIQPDKIDYVSENKKYVKTYTYNDWTWTDKTDCGEEEYCGGYVTIKDVYLEYAQGSNTFTSAISGATWQTDGVDVTLTENTDYTLSGNDFTVINLNYAWTNISTSFDYSYDANTNTSAVAHLIPISVAVILVVLLAGFVIYQIRRNS